MSEYETGNVESDRSESDSGKEEGGSSGMKSKPAKKVFLPTPLLMTISCSNGLCIEELHYGAKLVCARPPPSLN